MVAHVATVSAIAFPAAGFNPSFANVRAEKPRGAATAARRVIAARAARELFSRSWGSGGAHTLLERTRVCRGPRAGRHAIAVAATVTEDVVVTIGRPLGMVLEENANAQVFVVELVRGGNAEQSGEVQVEDVLLACGTDPSSLTPVADFDSAMDTLGSSPDSPTMTLKLRRTEPAPPGEAVTVVVEGAGELTLEPDSVLRTALLDAKVDLYTNYGKMMNCGGGGACGTCAVEVLEGMNQLSERTDGELRLLKKKPDNYRLACQTVCEGRGSGNITLRSKPK